VTRRMNVALLINSLCSATPIIQNYLVNLKENVLQIERCIVVPAITLACCLIFWWECYL